MYALLVLGDVKGAVKVLVNVKSQQIEQRFYGLLKSKRNREAFDLLKNKATVENYLPEGAKLVSIPQVTLVEDLL